GDGRLRASLPGFGRGVPRAPSGNRVSRAQRGINVAAYAGCAETGVARLLHRSLAPTAPPPTLGINCPTLEKHLEILDLPPDVRELVGECELTGRRTVFTRNSRPV